MYAYVCLCIGIYIHILKYGVQIRLIKIVRAIEIITILVAQTLTLIKKIHYAYELFIIFQSRLLMNLATIKELFNTHSRKMLRLIQKRII